MSKRFQRVTRASVRITERDLAVVEALFEARYMTNRQIGRLLFGNADSSHGRQRLRYLYDLDYVRKRTAGPNEPDIYYVGLNGRRYLSEQAGWNRGQVDRIAGVAGDDVATPALMMRHELTISALYVNARLESQERGWEMRWKNTRMLELERLGIEPDAWIGLTHGANRREAYIEFTAAMPNGAELESKLARYQAHWEARQKGLPVLWLTTSARKANRLLQSIRANEHRDCYLVGLIEDAGHFLTKRMWRWGDAEPEALNDMVQWVSPTQGS